MAHNEEREEATSRGNGWEVVSLSSSAYAAAPGPQLVDTNDVSGHTFEKDETMFMSGHFVFPPSQHENLPLEPENVEVPKIQEFGASFSRLGAKDYKWDDEGLGEPNEFDEGTTLQGLDSIEENQSPETTRGGQMEPLEKLLDTDILNSSNNAEEENEYDKSELPCEAWWKRGAASLYVQAKESKSFWSIFVAAAVVGLVVLGRRLHREKVNLLHHKWRLSFDSEKLMGLFGPISRFKPFVEAESHKSFGIQDSSFMGQ